MKRSVQHPSSVADGDLLPQGRRERRIFLLPVREKVAERSEVG